MFSAKIQYNFYYWLIENKKNQEIDGLETTCDFSLLVESPNCYFRFLTIYAGCKISKE